MRDSAKAQAVNRYLALKDRPRYQATTSLKDILNRNKHKIKIKKGKSYD